MSATLIREDHLDERTEEMDYRALLENTKAWNRTEVALEALGDRFQNLENLMTSTVSHLDSISHSMERTNELLEQSRLDRLAELEARKEEAERKEAATHDRKAVIRRVASEGWAFAKGPLGYLITAVCTYLAYYHFQVPVTPPVGDVAAETAPLITE
jgi:hypothetical protein